MNQDLDILYRRKREIRNEILTLEKKREKLTTELFKIVDLMGIIWARTPEPKIGRPRNKKVKVEE